MSASRDSAVTRTRPKEVAPVVVLPTRKLDARPSRGVLFENEEVRMRAIAINAEAEVERGQSDLRKLRRENESLKQQVWTLRDEYDRLEQHLSHNDDMDGTSDDEDDDDDDDGGVTSLGQRLSSTRIVEEGDDSNVETDNLENLQKVFRGNTLRSVDYPVRQTASLEGLSRQGGLVGGTTVNYGDSAKGGSVIESPSARRICDDSYACDSDEPVDTESYTTRNDHFNLDQLLDFASSFHYDRRRHLTEETPTGGPSVPAEEDGTDCSLPGTSYSTLSRRRSSTVIEKLKNANHIQMSSAAKLTEVQQQLSLCDDSDLPPPTCDIPSEMTNLDGSQSTTTAYSTRSSYFFAGPLEASRSQSLGAGLNAAANNSGNPRTSPITVNGSGTLFPSSSASNIANSHVTTSLEANLPLVSLCPTRSSLVRLNSIEPNTLMASVADIPQLWDITTQEIIDELEGQVEADLSEIRGVRVVGRAAFICLGRRDVLQKLLARGLTIRGGMVPLIDITRESIVLALAGVPHYIADATLAILLSAFGTLIGEIERRFYKGVDTGERFVRMKLKNHVKLPKYVTVGGCRIVLTIHGHDSHAHLHLSEWGGKGPPVSVPNTPYRPSSQPPESTTIGTDYLPHVASASALAADVLNGEKCESRRESVPSDSRTKSKTFSSRCMVNLKLPERSSSGGFFRSRDSQITHDSTDSGAVGNCESGGGLGVGTPTASTSVGTFNFLRSGTMGRFGKGNPTAPGSASPVTKLSSPTPGGLFKRFARRGTLSEAKLPESPRPTRPNSVAFDDPTTGLSLPIPRTSLTPPSHSSSVPCIPLGNGILRKSSVPEQEALLPGPCTPTATIRSRLKPGRSLSVDVGNKQSKGQQERERKQVSKMESISENTITDDISDISLLGVPGTCGGSISRRDSERSSQSAASKTSANPGRRKDVIDLPWCGCWGNGCF